jgi:hypothetical protein
MSMINKIIEYGTTLDMANSSRERRAMVITRPEAIELANETRSFRMHDSTSPGREVSIDALIEKNRRTGEAACLGMIDGMIIILSDKKEEEKPVPVRYCAYYKYLQDNPCEWD